MAKLAIQGGKTSQTVYLFVQDSSSTTGAGLTGLAYNTSSLVAYYVRPLGSATAITLATLAAATSAWSSGGFKEVDATNLPGVYRLDLPDAVLAASVRSALVMLKGAANMAPIVLEIELTGWDNQDAVRGGLTALPNANAEAAGGLYTRGTGAGQIKQDANGRIDVNVRALLDTAWLTPGTAGTPDVNAKLLGATAQTGRDIGASVLLSPGTGAGQLDFTAGVVKSNLVQILATALTETAGLLAGGFKKFFNVASPTLTCLGVDQTGDSYARLGAPAGASLSADVAAAKAQLVTVNADTDDIQSRLPAALTSGGRMKASVEAILDTAFTEGASGRIAAAFKQFFNIASPAATMDHGILVDTAADITTKTGYALTAAYDAAKTAAQAGDVMKVSSGTGANQVSLSSGLVTVGTNNDKTGYTASTVSDKTGYSLSSGGVQAIWDALTSALTTSGSIGKWILDKLDVVLSTRLATSGYTTPPTVGAIADQVWEETLGDHSGTSGSTAAALNAAGSAGDPWNTSLPGSYGAGTAGKIIGDNVNATISSRSTYAGGDTSGVTTLLSRLSSARAGYLDNLSAGAVALEASLQGLITTIGASAAGIATAVWGAATRVLTAGTNIVLAKGTGVTGFNDLDAAGVRTAVGLASANLDAQLDALPTNAELATSQAAADDATLAAIAALSIPTAIQNADALLSRDLGSGSGAGSLNERTVRAALRFSRNKFTIAGGTLTVYKEDDTTVAFTAAITQTAGDPVSASDPT